MSMLLVSCSKDKSTNPTNNGGDNNNNLPTTKITVITSLDGKQVDRKEINGNLDEYTPEGTSIMGYFENISNTFGFSITMITSEEINMAINFAVIMSKIENNTYFYTAEDGKLVGGNYVNTKITDNSMTISNCKLVISKNTYVGVDIAGIYYVTGSLTASFNDSEGNATDYKLIINFENLPISTAKNHL